MYKKVFFFSLFGVLFCVSNTIAQLNRVFDLVFNQILISDLFIAGSPGSHGNQFRPAAALASQELPLALNSLVANNIASFPLSSTVAGVTFDWSSGNPVGITESLGPIFAETAQTLGKSKVNLGFNYTYLSLSKFRGLSTRDFRFTFTHEDVGKSGVLGDNPNESDLVDVFLDLDINANIFAFSATLGVTNNLDIGMAIPVINIGLSGNARAVINSFTFARYDSAAYNFGLNFKYPELEDNVRYDESAAGIGDIAIRLKYNFLLGADVDLAALLDIRFPTGDEKNFLGMGKINARFSWIMSKKVGDFSPHLNIGYNRRLANLDSDEFELTVGFDQKIATGVTFAAEFLGEFDLNSAEAIQLLPGTQTIIDQPSRNARNVREVDLSNVPESNHDHTLNLAVGFRVAPTKRFSLLGNILVSLNDGGLRSNVASTLGMTLSF